MKIMTEEVSHPVSKLMLYEEEACSFHFASSCEGNTASSYDFRFFLTFATHHLKIFFHRQVYIGNWVSVYVMFTTTQISCSIPILK